MDAEVKRRKQLCERASDPEWDVVVAAGKLTAVQQDFIRAHPPGLVAALWAHFDATRDVCGCSSPGHEKADCPVGLIERLLLEDESA
jgi:hypothetical protein